MNRPAKLGLSDVGGKKQHFGLPHRPTALIASYTWVAQHCACTSGEPTGNLQSTESVFSFVSNYHCEVRHEMGRYN